MKKPGLSLRYLFTAAILIRLIVIPLFYHPDLKSQYFHFQFLSSGVTDIYTFISKNKDNLPYRDTFNYLPLTYFTFGSYYAVIKPILPADLSVWLNDWGIFQNHHSNFPIFLFGLKLPYLFLDLAIGLLLFRIYSRKSVLLLWLFNPISIYLIYVLGNFDVLPVFLTLLSYYLLRLSRRPPAFLVLGLAIALKIYPLILFPFFLLTAKPKFLRLIRDSGFALLPLVLSLLPFIFNPTFQSSFMGSGLTQKILESRLYGLPLFPTVYLIVFGLFGLHQYQNSYKLRPDNYLLAIFFLFVSLVNFHPQWLLWLLPFLVSVYNQKRSYTILLTVSFVLLFIYIALFNDQYLFWGHLVAIDPDFLFITQPNVLFEKYTHLSAVDVRQYIHLILLLPASLSLLSLLKSNEN